jgi:hypothetical protein
MRVDFKTFYKSQGTLVNAVLPEACDGDDETRWGMTDPTVEVVADLALGLVARVWPKSAGACEARARNLAAWGWDSLRVCERRERGWGLFIGAAAWARGLVFGGHRHRTAREAPCSGRFRRRR